MIIHEEIAQAALTHSDLSNVQLTFLQQSQNTTFRVETVTKDKFLLRFHTGIEAASSLPTQKCACEVWGKGKGYCVWDLKPFPLP
ncbi:MAG: hypothetical protein V7K94_30795 [Nostoc sp.]|uniref:hypothetical protein n=1 Tax=Nostoc sp. TaxID=1180 RepID=UPI002FF8FD43